MHGGDAIGRVLERLGVGSLFTLCGGHISPILTGCKKAGLKVIDVRDEATAVYAADASARITGIPGVAAVTAGPGVTNSVTAVKNAEMAQSPVIIIGGAAATVLKGRGSLQDIDQRRLMKSIVKKYFAVKKTCDIVPVLEHAFLIAVSGVPGPVFVECPIDILYGEEEVRAMYGVKAGSSGPQSVRSRLLQLYLKRHVDRIFSCDLDELEHADFNVPVQGLPEAKIRQAAAMITQSEKPLLVVGSQSMLHQRESARLAGALESMGVPVYLAGMARGLMGKGHRFLMHHRRKEAVRESDCVVLAGMPADFRLDYGRSFNPCGTLISINRNRNELYLNVRPRCAIHGDPFMALCAVASELRGRERSWDTWREILAARDATRSAEIDTMASGKTAFINPLKLLKALDRFLDDNTLIVADGGDFVASASYIVHPRAPLSWLDPGVFGTLGVGAGFALGAKLARPRSETWILYGDGAAGYSLQEFDTFARHGIPVIALIGNDAGWTQIARDQVAYLHDDVATRLEFTDYQRVAEGFGGRGILIKTEREILPAFRKARSLAKRGAPVLINARIGVTDFRKGSISM